MDNIAEKKDYMSVAEMGTLLGLKKTGRYWLLHKGYFKTRQIAGKTWIDTESFETWYAGQAKYHKVNGEAPAARLRETSYSARDIAEMLNICENGAYEIIKNNRLETIIVDGWRRVPRDVFEAWYAGQVHYRKPEDRERDAQMEERTLSLPEMAGLLGIDRKRVYRIVRSRAYGDLFDIVEIAGRKRITKESFYRFLRKQDQYSLQAAGDILLTQEEAAVIAGVARSMLDEWAKDKRFPVIKAGGRVRIPQKEFLDWLRERESEG